MDSPSPVRGLISAGLDLILPAACISCARPGADACGECLALNPGSVRRSGLEVQVAGRYEGTLRLCLLRFKEHGQRRMAVPLGHALAEAVDLSAQAAGTREVLLVAIPSARRARRLRGMDHVRVLGDVAAADLAERGLSVRTTAFRAVRSVNDQVGLDSVQRRANLNGALELPSGALPDRTTTTGGGIVVVVDDIVTTGATLIEGVRAAHEAGCPDVAVAAIAAA